MAPRRPIRTGVLALAVAGAILPGTALPPDATAARCTAASSKPGEVTRRTAVGSTLCLLNARRRRHHLRPLRLNSRLSKAARRHSRDMVRRGYFAHVSPSGMTLVARIRRTRYLGAHHWIVGENLAWGTRAKGSPRAIVRAWMQSPHHRDNILHPSFRDVGIGIVSGAPRLRQHPAATYTTDFGVTR